MCLVLQSVVSSCSAFYFLWASLWYFIPSVSCYTVLVGLSCTPVYIRLAIAGKYLVSTYAIGSGHSYSWPSIGLPRRLERYASSIGGLGQSGFLFSKIYSWPLQIGLSCHLDRTPSLSTIHASRQALTQLQSLTVRLKELAEPPCSESFRLDQAPFQRTSLESQG